MRVTSYSLTLVFDELTEDMHEIVDDEVVALQNALYVVGEDVRDTGNFKRAFAPLDRMGEWKWKIVNDAIYADILSRGRRSVGGRMYGSEKWSGGINPMIEKTEKNIKDKTDAIRL